MSTGTPNRWITMIALVRSVIRPSMSAALWFITAPGSQSEKTGMAFCSMMPSTEPMSVTGAVMISSPGSGSMAPTAACIAPVPESVATAYLTPCRLAKPSSNSRTL